MARPTDQATRASPEPASGLGHSASVLRALAEQCEAATGPDRELDRAIEDRCAPERIGKIEMPMLEYTASLDAAMTLVPEIAVNIDVFSFMQGGGKQCWGCRFHDTAQLMGARAAKEQIARLNKDTSFGEKLRGPTRVIMEKAIAEHYCEFFCRGAATPALALCAAALRARSTQPGDRLGRHD